MRRLIRIQYALAILFVVVGASFLLFFHHRYHAPSLLLSNSEFVQGANSIQDIEHLRKLLLVVARGGDEAAMTDWKAIDAAASVIFAVCLLAAVTLFVCASQFSKIEKGRDKGANNAP